MAKIEIDGIPPWDGNYELDLSSLKNRELSRIKAISGVRAGELYEALGAGDNDLLVALTVVALERAGKQPSPDDIWDAEFGAVRFDFSDDQEDADAVPPQKSPSDSSGIDSSGADSESDGDLNPPIPSPTGSPGLATAAESA